MRTVPCAASILFLVVLSPVLPTENPLYKIGAIHVEGESPTAAYVREKLRSGFQCLKLAEDRKSADAVLQLHTSETAARGMLGERKNFALVSGLLEDPFGAHLWDFTQRTPGTGIERATDAILKKLARDCQCKKRMKVRPR